MGRGRGSRARSARSFAAPPPAAERAAPAPRGPRCPGRARLVGSLSPLARPVLSARPGGGTRRTGFRSLSGPRSAQPRRRAVAGPRPLGGCGGRLGVGRVSPRPSPVPCAAPVTSSARRSLERGAGPPEKAEREKAQRDERAPQASRSSQCRKLRSGPGSLPAASREGPAAGVGRRRGASPSPPPPRGGCGGGAPRAAPFPAPGAAGPRCRRPPPPVPVAAMPPPSRP